MINLQIIPIFGLDNILTFKKGGGIHIKKKNRGKFTKSAKAAGESVLEHAAKVLSDPNATPLLKKRANFARNVAKWKHLSGGTLLQKDKDSLNKSESIESKVSTAIMNLIHRGKIKPSNHPVPDLVRDGGVALRTYLLNREDLKKEFLNAGYIEGKEGDYGLVRKAVGDRNIPIYQRAPDAAKREDLVPIGNINNRYFPYKGELFHAGHYPTALYYNYQDNKLYLKAWDLNDYGGNTGYAKKYNFLQKLGANILDKIGSPTVVTSGFLEIPEDVLYSNYNELFPYLKNFYKSKGLEYDFLVDPYKDTPTLHLPEIVVTNKLKKYAEGGYIKENNNYINGYVREKNNNPVSFDELGNLTDLVTGEKGTMMLPEITVTKINPKNPLYNRSKYIALYTYYPIVSSYPYTGHSRLTITAIDKDRYRSYSINKTPRHKDYNLITNNCSDATREALEKTFNKKSNPLLFTTPGDVQDFALKQLNGIPEIKGDSIYDRTSHKYILNKYPNKGLYNKRKVVYIPINDNLKNFLKLYIEQGHKNHLFKKGGNIIQKGQRGLVTLSDNTRVVRPIILEKIPYKLKSNEFYFIDKKTDKKIIGRLKQEVISSDNRNTKLRKQDWTKAKLILKKLEADKNYNEGLKTIGTLSTLAMPSTYIGPVFNNNGKSYLDNVISGEGTGNVAGNLAIDLAIPFGFRLFNKGYPYKTFRGTLAIKASSKSSYMDSSGIKITPESEIFLKYPIYKSLKKSKHFTPFDAPYFEELIADKNVTLLGLLDAGEYSKYLAERIIQNMENQGFDPNISNSLLHNGKVVYGKPSTFIREKSTDPIDIYVTDESTNIIGFLIPSNGKAYARIYQNATPEKIRLNTIHEGISHGTDDVVNSSTDGAAADQYGRITKAVKDAGFARTKGTEQWYELRSTMAEFMAKMFRKHTKAVPDSTCADVQDAVYKEIDNMSVNKLAEEFKSLNSYGRDYAEYLMLNPFEANKFKTLLKYGMGISAPIGVTTYGFKKN